VYQTLLVGKALEMRMNHGSASCCSSQMAKVMASDNFLSFFEVKIVTSREFRRRDDVAVSSVCCVTDFLS